MKSPLQDYFDFSRKEQMGLLAMVGVILACLLVINFHHVLFPEEEVDVTQKEQELMAAIEAEREKKDEEFTRNTDFKKEKKTLPEPFAFDPNTLDEEGYESLGFSPKQASSIRNYLSKGGQIRKTEDFKKLYVVDDFMYERLKDFIQIAPRVQVDRAKEYVNTETRYEKSYPTESIQSPVDLNNADSLELIALRGIGPFYASRIIKYRDILRGYSSVDQLGEVYGLKDHPEIIESLRPKLFIGDYSAPLIDINTCEWVDLVRLPDIDKNVANSIMNMRKTHGSYSQVSDILQSHLIDEALYDKISPYLTVGSR